MRAGAWGPRLAVPPPVLPVALGADSEAARVKALPVLYAPMAAPAALVAPLQLAEVWEARMA